MNPGDKVPSVELCMELHDLGITKEVITERTWERPLPLEALVNMWIISRRRLPNDKYAHQYETIPAPDLSELGELLDNLKENDQYYKSGNTCFDGDIEVSEDQLFNCELWGDCELDATFADTETNARAKMLIKLKEQELKQRR